VSRQGLNGHLTYTVNKKRYVFDMRVGQLSHGVQMLATESMARTRRAYYPHRATAIPFVLTVILKGYSERVAFSNYLNDYTNRSLDPALAGGFPQMTVTVPVRNFMRYGVPLSGIEWGSSVGAMLWQPQVTFETTYEQNLGDNTSGTVTSKFVLDNKATSRAPELKYFYPSGIQLSGDQVPPPGDYTTQMGAPDIASIIGGGSNPSTWPGVPYAPGNPGPGPLFS
jgi:hypothetical protein